MMNRLGSVFDSVLLRSIVRGPVLGPALRGLVAAAVVVGSGCSSSEPEAKNTEPERKPPNILFITIDDVGVDVLRAFGYGGELSPPADTVSIDAIANAGVRFRNTWSMPTCSPTRTSIFSGQYPSRTGVMNAVTSNDLAQSQASPYTLTTPKLLREKGYVSALIGKMHLTGSDINPDNHPLGDGAMRELGWDYFAGYLDGGPYPIDTTAGGVAPEGTHACGFVPTSAVDPENGADAGVCYLADGEHLEMAAPEFPTPGRTCVERGGIFDPSGAAPSEERRAELDFETQNGYYTGAWKVNHEDGSDEHIAASDPRARGYRTTLETDRAIEWLEGHRERHPDTPWMLSVGYSGLHTPLQPPPAALLPHPDASLSLIGCGAPVADLLPELGGGKVTDLAEFAQARAVAQHMLEALDHEIGRLLVAAGVALRDDDGKLRHDPDSDVVVVLVGDNGTYAPSVKLPFDFQRAKGTPYQTGVWVPLAVAGPVVSEPDRDVEAMVNTTDLYRLFGEIAGVDMDAIVDARRLDAEPVLPYLTSAAQEPIREFNFTEMGTNVTGQTPPPCVITSVGMCVQIFPQRGVCEDQGGVWYGPGSEAVPEGLETCCEVNALLEEEGQPTVDVFPRSQRAIRDMDHKLVRIERLDCGSGEFDTVDELYEVDQSRDPEELKLDRADANILADGPEGLTSEQRQRYEALAAALEAIVEVAPVCPGDGNRDGKVDQVDLDEWERWSRAGGSSWYDFDLDGKTDETDKAIIEENLGRECG